uniref:ATP synthase subunit b, chloroplastic n=1 Tax=Acetabularia acetabulum TaxID=35845 RepID=W6MDC5_ACEAT|nr:F0 sector of membrane-bound ATP synthase, subunit b [Acetabularia acetabulum]
MCLRRLPTFIHFNTNILETNILNLSVVVGVVVSFGGDALRSLLDNRKQIILNNLQEAEQRANEAQEKLNKARNQLEISRQKALEIHQQGEITVKQEMNQCIQQTQDDINRLEEMKLETLFLYKQKTISQFSYQVILMALQQVRDKLKNIMDSSIHTAINNFNIALFKNYKP